MNRNVRICAAPPASEKIDFSEDFYQYFFVCLLLFVFVFVGIEKEKNET